MNLADLRKLAIRKQLKIRFRLQNGMECVITEHGLAQVPALQRVPQFNLEHELASAAEFLLDPAGPPGKDAPHPRRVTREELAPMVSEGSAATGGDHEEE